MTDAIRLYTDGGARGNPGPAGAGFVLYRGDEQIASGARYLGEMTNNQAEYHAVIDGLRKAQSLGIKKMAVYMDSELIVNQLQRKYKIKNAELGKLFVQAWNVMQSFQEITFTHIPREENKEADRLANQAMDQGQ